MEIRIFGDCCLQHIRIKSLNAYFINGSMFRYHNAIFRSASHVMRHLYEKIKITCKTELIKITFKTELKLTVSLKLNRMQLFMQWCTCSLRTFTNECFWCSTCSIHYYLGRICWTSSVKLSCRLRGVFLGGCITLVEVRNNCSSKPVWAAVGVCKRGVGWWRH